MTEKFLLKLLSERNKRIDNLICYKVVVEFLKEELMKSNLPIGEVSYLMSILNFSEDGTCTNESSFYDKSQTNTELRRILEVM